MHEDDDAPSPLIATIRRLYRQKLGRKQGTVIERWEGCEVGITTHNFVVLSRDGVYEEYWTDPGPPRADRAIVSELVRNGDLQEWESLDEADLEKFAAVLRAMSDR